MLALATDTYNASEVLDRNLDEGRADKTAYVASDATLSYDELRRQVNRFGHLLREPGVGREERVLLVLDDTTVFPIAFLGAIRLGAVPVPVSPLDKDDNFRHFIADSYARVVICDAMRLDALRETLAGRDLQFVARGADGAVELDGALAAQDDELAPASTHRDDMAFWLYSSGSTGRPKGVVHLQHDIAITCEGFAGGVLGMRENDRIDSTTKLYHAYGRGNGMSFPLHFGATAILVDGPPKPERIVAALREHRPTVFCSVPALYAQVAAHSDADGALNSVRVCVSATEPLPPATFDRWIERFALEIVDGIGSTETLHIYCFNRPGDVVRGTTGRPVPGGYLRLVDDDGSVVKGPAVGNLEVRGESCAAFYWHQHEKTKRCMRGEWFASGDRYERCADGTYACVGRSDDTLKSGGLWVSPVDMENVLIEHPAVAALGVVGTTVGSQSRVAAFIELADGATGDERLANDLRTWCTERMRPYEYPQVVRFLDELPRTLTGKVQRYKLRELAQEEAQ